MHIYICPVCNSVALHPASNADVNPLLLQSSISHNDSNSGLTCRTGCSHDYAVSHWLEWCIMFGDNTVLALPSVTEAAHSFHV